MKNFGIRKKFKDGWSSFKEDFADVLNDFFEFFSTDKRATEYYQRSTISNGKEFYNGFEINVTKILNYKGMIYKDTMDYRDMNASINTLKKQHSEFLTMIDMYEAIRSKEIPNIMLSTDYGHIDYSYMVKTIDEWNDDDYNKNKNKNKRSYCIKLWTDSDGNRRMTKIYDEE